MRKIIEVTKETSLLVTVVNARGDTIEYRRVSPTCWERLWGMSWEMESYPEPLEKLFQEYIK